MKPITKRAKRISPSSWSDLHEMHNQYTLRGYYDLPAHLTAPSIEADTGFWYVKKRPDGLNHHIHVGERCASMFAASRKDIKARAGAIAVYEHERMHSVLTTRSLDLIQHRCREARVPFRLLNLAEDIRIEITGISSLGVRCFDWMRWGVVIDRDPGKDGHAPHNPYYPYHLLYAYKVAFSSQFTRARIAGQKTMSLNRVTGALTKAGWLGTDKEPHLIRVIGRYALTMSKARDTEALIPILQNFVRQFPVPSAEAMDSDPNAPGDNSTISRGGEYYDLPTERAGAAEERHEAAKKKPAILPSSIVPDLAGNFGDEPAPDPKRDESGLGGYVRRATRNHEIHEDGANLRNCGVTGRAQWGDRMPRHLDAAERYAQSFLAALPRPRRIRLSTEPDRFTDVDFQGLMEHRPDFWRRRTVADGTIGTPTVLLGIDLSSSMNGVWIYQMRPVALAFALLAERGAIKLRMIVSAADYVAYFGAATVYDVSRLFPHSNAEGINAALAAAAGNGWHIADDGSPATVIYLTDGRIEDDPVNKAHTRAAGIYPIGAYAGDHAEYLDLGRYFDVFSLHSTADELVSDLASIVANAASMA